MQGTDSQAMVMAAQDGDKVELLKVITTGP